MKCFVYIDFSLNDGGRTVGFATATIELPELPVVGADVSIGNFQDPGRIGIRTNFLITRVSAPYQDGSINSDLSWIVTCDDNFFESQEEISKVVRNLERSGFVYEEI